MSDESLWFLCLFIIQNKPLYLKIDIQNHLSGMHMGIILIICIIDLDFDHNSGHLIIEYMYWICFHTLDIRISTIYKVVKSSSLPLIS